jgi:3-dehydroquinate dehydratase-2
MMALNRPKDASFAWLAGPMLPAPVRPGQTPGAAACGAGAPHATGAGPWKTGISVNPPLIAVLNGPNLNLLGTRQPEVYGRATLDDVEALCAETAEALGLAIDFRQTNGEGELITWVQECRGRAAGIVINPAGYSHTSVALMDALKTVDLPVVEVHISNIHRREEFRHLSYVSKAATGVIAGLGIQGYALALRAMAELLAEEGEP